MVASVMPTVDEEEAGISTPMQLSWLEANQQAPRRLIEPGDVSFLSDKKSQRAMRQSAWFPVGRVPRTNVLLFFCLFVVFNLNAILFYVFCGFNLFVTVAHMISTNSFIFGKAWVLRSARQKASPCVQPLAYCPPERLRVIQDRFPGMAEEGLFGHRVLFQLWMLFSFLPVFATHVLVVYSAWGAVPLWAWVSLLAAPVFMPFCFAVDNGIVFQIATTDLFVRSCDALIESLEQYGRTAELKPARGLAAPPAVDSRVAHGSRCPVGRARDATATAPRSGPRTVCRASVITRISVFKSWGYKRQF